MEISEWWPRLDVKPQHRLIDNNGDVVPPAVLDKINQAGGEVASEASPIAGDEGQGGLVLPDCDVDWIEQVANEEP